MSRLTLISLLLALGCHGTEFECCVDGVIDTCTSRWNTYPYHPSYVDCGEGTCALEDFDTAVDECEAL